MNATSASAAGVARCSPQRAYEICGALDAAQFYPKSGPLPGVVAVRGQSGSWNAVGRTRTLMLSDGGQVMETITDAASPQLFAYELSEFQKLFGRLVTGARAEWNFDPVESGTRIRWTYTFFAKPGRAWIVAPIVRLLWGPYMARVLPPIVREIERLS